MKLMCCCLMNEFDCEIMLNRMEKVNIRSMRSIAKIVGTIICISGATAMVLLKGPKLLNAENNWLHHQNPTSSAKFVSFFEMVAPSLLLSDSEESDHNWLIGCLCLFAACTAWSLWFILQVRKYTKCNLVDHINYHLNSTYFSHH
jgi:hypothetical protein